MKYDNENISILAMSTFIFSGLVTIGFVLYKMFLYIL